TAGIIPGGRRHRSLDFLYQPILFGFDGFFLVRTQGNVQTLYRNHQVGDGIRNPMNFFILGLQRFLLADWLWRDYLWSFLAVGLRRILRAWDRWLVCRFFALGAR